VYLRRTMRHVVHVPSAVALFAALTLLGQGCFFLDDDFEDPVSAESPRINPCDIVSVSCQQWTLDWVELERESTSGRLPSVRVVSEEEFAAKVQPSMTPPNMEASNFETIMRLLGVAPQNQSLEEATAMDSAMNVAARYYPDEDEVLVVARESMDPRLAVIVLAHELVHALQDQEGAFELEPSALDARVSYRAAVEGEASYYELRVGRSLGWYDLEDGQWDSLLDDWTERVRSDVADSSWPMLAASRWLPYPLGTRWVLELFRSGGDAAAREAVRNFPNHSRELLFDDEPNARSELREVQCPLGSPFDGLTELEGEPLGRLLVWAFLQAYLSEDWLAWLSAAHLESDRIHLFEEPNTGARVLGWRMRFEDSALAQDISTELREQRQSWHVARWGDELQIVVSSDESVFHDWVAPDDASPCPVGDDS